jgi:hypothetical protein
MAMAKDIEALKINHPQLADFSAASHYNVDGLYISYAFRTHRPEGRAGWAGGVPNPNDDGVWFTIDLHDPDSMAQLHTQPLTEDLRLGRMKVTFLILQGAQTSNIYEALREILEKYGVRGPQPP